MRITVDVPPEVDFFELATGFDLIVYWCREKGVKAQLDQQGHPPQEQVMITARNHIEYYYNRMPVWAKELVNKL